MNNDPHNSYVAIGADELGEYLGKTIRCTRCGGTHAIEYSGPSTIHHPDGTTSVGPAGTLQFYRCGDDLFLAGVKGRALAHDLAMEGRGEEAQDLRDAITHARCHNTCASQVRAVMSECAIMAAARERERHADALRCALEALDYCIEDSAELLNERTTQWGGYRQDRQAAMAEALERHRAVAERLRAMLGA